MYYQIHHIYWFAPFNLNSPSTRYRGKYPLEYLQKYYNIKSDFIFPAQSFLHKLRFLRMFLSVLLFRKSNSLIVIQKICSNRLYAKSLKFLIFSQRKNTLYDLDDAEYLRNKTQTLHYFLRKCESVSVGSKALFDYCLQFNEKVYMQTSPVAIHKEKKVTRNEILNIGWVGDFGNGNQSSKSFSHKTNLYDLFFPQIRLIKHTIKLSLIGVKTHSDIDEIKQYFKKHPNIQLDIPTNLDWKDDLWVYSKIAEFDLGISPMIDHPFLHAKSAFKAKQYLSCGVPVIASDIGENNKFVKHEFNGILCDKKEKIKLAIQRFIDMEDQEYLALCKNSMRNRNSYSMPNYCEILITQHNMGKSSNTPLLHLQPHTTTTEM